MSVYFVMQGEIKYPDEASFKQIVTRLKDGFWLDEEGFLLDEEQARVTGHPNINKENLSIEIPCALYRNLSFIDFFLNDQTIEEISANVPNLHSKVKGSLVGASTDGRFIGFVIEDGVETHYDLKEWAAENIDQKPPELIEDFLDWQEMVVREFVSDHT